MKAPENVLLLNAPRAAVVEPPRIRRAVSAAVRRGSWRYDAGEARKRWPWAGMAVSAGLHLLVFFGIQPSEAPVVAMVPEETIIELVEMPKLEDLEDPELVDERGEGEPVDEAVSYVPMLADLPAVVQVDSFIQALDFSTLEVKPDFSNAKIVAIPPGARRVGPNVSERLKNVFELADLDRPPEPVFQPSPVFPVHLRREVTQARVDLEFVVGVDGKVSEIRAIYASVGGFEEAAIAGVSRWQFRAGMKGGRKVNTRIRIPIVFRAVDGV